MDRHKLLNRMLEQGKSQRDLAEATGLTCAAISRICSGKNNPRIDTMKKIANYLNCKIDDLV